jgi:hypothetical protein
MRETGVALPKWPSDIGTFNTPDPDSLIDSNHATNGAEWLLRHRTHILSHNERGLRCMDCEGRPDDQWLMLPAWNDRAESRDEVLEDVRQRAQGILDIVKNASKTLGEGTAT